MENSPEKHPEKPLSQDNSLMNIFLPDGSQRQFAAHATLFDVAKNISNSLAKIAIAGKINGVLADLGTPLQNNDHIEIYTNRNDEGLEIIRHSTAHILAMAIQELFPGTQITIGPVVENQFYYDVFPQPDVKISAKEFPSIEAKMKEIVDRNLPIVKKVLSRDEAIATFEQLGEKFKVEIIQDLPDSEEIKIYQMGHWFDLCRGPHVPSTGKVGAFKLMSIAGAYWRANKENDQLVRIYGTAWATQKDLDQYLHQLEEAKKRDHVALGKQLELFTLMSDVAPGAAFFFSKGSKIFTLMQNYIRKKLKGYGFEEIQTPQVMNVQLWKTSGHYEKYSEDMYMFKDVHGEEFGIKPMSCPAHVKLYMSGMKSYRDLPKRYAEFGVVHRNELSGTLHGLTRVRRITQDDGHIFCTMDQIQFEIENAIRLVQEAYADFGFPEVQYFLSTRPENKIGSEDIWDVAENALEKSLEALEVSFKINPGDGAFYGPKIDFKVKDAIGRLHQCATIQLDFQMPGRFGATYQASSNQSETPVMIHRAVFGSVERFMGIFIEHTAGHFPVGLAPVQCRILTVTSACQEFANQAAVYLSENGVRVETDDSHEKLGSKIRDAQLLKIPYMIIVGEKEVQAQQLSPRFRDGTQKPPMKKEEFLDLIKQESGVFWGLDVNQG